MRQIALILSWLETLITGKPILWVLPLALCSALLIGTVLTPTASLAQCQLAFNEENTGDEEEVNLEELIDLSPVLEINPMTEEYPEIPQQFLNFVGQVGYLAGQEGDFNKALQCYLYNLRHYRNPNMIYNAACMFSMAGHPEKAVEYLQHSVDFGYNNLEWLHQDTDLDPIRELPEFQAITNQLEANLQAIAEAEGAALYFEAPVMAKAVLRLPDNYDPEKSYKLLIGMHGAMGNCDRFGTLANYFNEHDFIYCALQAPYYQAGQDGSTGYLWFGALPQEDEELNRSSRQLNTDYVANALLQLLSDYNIDSTYLVGFSQGAAMCYLTATDYPELVDGIIVFGGWLDPSWISEDELANASDLRVFIAHGDQDGIEGAEASRDALQAAGIDVSYNIFPGGHFVHLDTLLAAEEWMKQ